MKFHKVLKISAVIVLVYCIGYAINSINGGYGKVPEIDGRDRYAGGLAMATAIKWKPVLGNWLVHDGDYWGFVFYPLLMLDRTYWHETHYITDMDFFEWAQTVPGDKWK